MASSRRSQLRELPEGWLTGQEADKLGALAAGLVVLELGAWRGRSTVVFAEQAALVISVDRHQGIWKDSAQESLPAYLENVASLGNVVPVVGSFEQVVPHLRGIDLVYIDGDHDEPSVRRDIGLALSVEPSMIVFHDWDAFEVTQSALAEFGREPDGVWGSVAWYVL